MSSPFGTKYGVSANRAKTTSRMINATVKIQKLTEEKKLIFWDGRGIGRGGIKQKADAGKWRWRQSS